jgi:hypothetical protein
MSCVSLFCLLICLFVCLFVGFLFYSQSHVTELFEAMKASPDGCYQEWLAYIPHDVFDAIPKQGPEEVVQFLTRCRVKLIGGNHSYAARQLGVPNLWPRDLPVNVKVVCADNAILKMVCYCMLDRSDEFTCHSRSSVHCTTLMRTER